MTNQRAKWKIMVYMSADGLLANFAVESLKQLKRAAGDGVVVVAQLDTDAIIHARRYAFGAESYDRGAGKRDGKGGGVSFLEGNKLKAKLPQKLQIADPKNLTKFIDDAVQMDPPADHHALFLWGHGPELLADEDPVSKNDSAKTKPRRYLTPSNLQEALRKAQLPIENNQKKKIDILGLDACSMSMVELASELGDHVNFMVASQDDVPDQSFPYEDILRRLGELANANDARKASTSIPEVYRKAYSDYISDPRTGFRPFTLSAIDLDKKKMGRLTTQLTTLARLLLELSKREDAGRKILTARKKAQGFVFGLFVDIVDLCQKFRESDVSSNELKDTCLKIQQIIQDSKEVVIANAVHVNTGDGAPPDGNLVPGGLSIYFPYRVADPPDSLDQTEALQQLRAKGTREVHSKERGLRIGELEQDFAKLQDFRGTDWMKFIQGGWSSILTKEAEQGRLDLDEVYSAQQCAQNLLRHEPPGGEYKERRAA